MPKRKKTAEKQQQDRLRRRLLFQKCSNCFYCGMGLSFSKTTLDHVIPRGFGGTDNDCNIVLSCRPCNDYKANEFYLLGMSDGWITLVVYLRDGSLMEVEVVQEAAENWLRHKLKAALQLAESR